jgi:hypothetical protein
MKKIISALCVLFASAAFGATTVPVQLLNPTGSSSGQAIVSTGSSSAPAWGGIGVNGIAAIAANTVLANATGSSASPTAFAMPSCSASGGTLQWTSGTGFTCVANAFASPPSTGYGSTTPEPVAATTISATGLITPTSTIGIKGTTTNDNAQAGSDGEYQTVTGSSAGITGGTNTNVTSISLTAGDWDVQGVVLYTPTATITSGYSGISTTSVTFGALGSYSSSGGAPVTAVQLTPSSPVVRISLASTTTVYLIGNVSFASGTCTAQGFIRARRVR